MASMVKVTTRPTINEYACLPPPLYPFSANPVCLLCVVLLPHSLRHGRPRPPPPTSLLLMARLLSPAQIISRFFFYNRFRAQNMPTKKRERYNLIHGLDKERADVRVQQYQDVLLPSGGSIHCSSGAPPIRMADALVIKVYTWYVSTISPSESKGVNPVECIHRWMPGSGWVHGWALMVAARGGGTQFVQGCSRMTIDARIPTMPGRSTSGFHQPGRYRLHQARSAVRCSTSRMKVELHPSKNRS